jgi:hypothetical protein
LKRNVVGIVGGVIAFISLTLPWWTITRSLTGLPSFSESLSIYPYQVTHIVEGASVAVTIDIWYGGAALALIIFGGFLGIVGSLVRTTRMILAAGGVLALLAIIVFALGLQSELSNGTLIQGYPAMGLFSSGMMGGYVDYSAYLSYGFWLALVSAVIMLVAFFIKPKVTRPIPTPPSLTSSSPTPTPPT